MVSNKEWAVCTATVIAVINADQDVNLDQVDAFLDQQPSTRCSAVEIKHSTLGRDELSVRVTYGPVLGGAPSDLRRWMRNAIVRARLPLTDVVILYWDRQVLRSDGQLSAAVSDLQNIVNDTGAPAFRREWASQRVAKLQQYIGTKATPVASAPAATHVNRTGITGGRIM